MQLNDNPSSKLPSQPHPYLTNIDDKNAYSLNESHAKNSQCPSLPLSLFPRDKCLAFTVNKHPIFQHTQTFALTPHSKCRHVKQRHTPHHQTMRSLKTAYRNKKNHQLAKSSEYVLQFLFLILLDYKYDRLAFSINTIRLLTYNMIYSLT